MFANTAPTLFETVGKWIDFASKLGGFIAFCGGFVWAYYKFIVKKPLAPRLEIAVTGELAYSNKQAYLKIGVKAKNIGESEVAINQEGCEVKISTFNPTEEPVSEIKPIDTDHLDLFKGRSRIQSGETVEDWILAKIPHQEILGVLVTATVSSLQEETKWWQSTIVNCQMKPEESDSSKE